ncbi:MULTISPECIES: cytochrome c oxidase subunit II [Sphingobium]|uniref:cytochrome c oxidase subunit II n=1 Tax=Sphingobium TaxID=165695 RepID=UPI001BE96662|nr:MULTISPECIES: cytochrome c oxidase subunit II [Sphingobium]MBT2245093.1 cytochrome c oxidase subunit II [Sphingobium sp. BHU LFT2]WBQ18934.1 cytochrome c oxidase subunit II [Sphingobium yanoikuyae]
MSKFGLSLLMLLLGACSGIQTPLSPAGDQASALHSLFLLMMIVCGGVYLIIIGAIMWSVLAAKARRRNAAPDGSEKILNRGFYSAAAGIVVGLTILIVGSLVVDRALIAARDDDALHIRVTGHQWWWRIEYSDPASGRWIETANELHLPLGRTARVQLASGDVIHSFWVPNVAGKIDMIPGRRNLVDLTPRRLGWFRGQCAEFCGTQHAHMSFDVKVDTPAQFDAWLARQSDPVAAGALVGSRAAALFLRVCGSCHAVRGTPAVGRAGPDLTHFASRRSIAAGTVPMTRGGIQGWLAQPQALKPGTSMPAVPLVPADADAVATYLESLR